MNRFSLIGAGRVGSNLSHALQKKGFQLQYVFKKALHNQYPSHITNDISKLVQDSDFIFICVQESKIRPVAELVCAATAPLDKIFFHTANSCFLIKHRTSPDFTGIFRDRRDYQLFIIEPS